MTLHSTFPDAGSGVDGSATFAGVRGVVRYRRWRPVGKPVAVLLVLHGLGEHSGQYATLAAAATSAGVEVWAPDQAGHGNSDGERVLITDVSDLVADAETLLRVVRASLPRVPVVVLGHSLGATVATLLVGEVRRSSDGRDGTADDPASDVTGLVLAGSSLGGASGLETLLASGIDPWELRKDPGELVRDPEQAERVRNDPLVWAGGLRPETLRALAAAAPRTSRLVTVGALDHLPVLLLHGEDDDIAGVAGARAVAAALPRGRIVTYPLDRHNVLQDLDRDVVHAELLRFVTALAARA
ncbi:alpha/beta fold hydrolase [Pseudonocardia sp. GCM10023141]|uniref:alpha/beta fold hydrolase n=1 Tax=Pseudonocardia sp. GCM10023141 TaxID=3252653 RepID=UPI0036097019